MTRAEDLRKQSRPRSATPYLGKCGGRDKNPKGLSDGTPKDRHHLLVAALESNQRSCVEDEISWRARFSSLIAQSFISSLTGP